MVAYILTALFAITQIGDWYTTEKVLAQGGHEVNPIMATIFKVLPPQLALPLKGIIATVIVWFLTSFMVGLFIDVVLIGIYSFVVAHNWLQIKK
jgi:hypothetical protein